MGSRTNWINDINKFREIGQNNGSSMGAQSPAKIWEAPSVPRAVSGPGYECPVPIFCFLSSVRSRSTLCCSFLVCGVSLGLQALLSPLPAAQPDRGMLGVQGSLSLSFQVKVWFQNRRIKWRKQSLEQKAAKLSSQFGATRTAPSGPLDRQDSDREEEDLNVDL